MRASRIAALTALTIGTAGVIGCGDQAPGGPFGDDRAEVLRVTRAYTAADAGRDAAATCELLTTRMQRLYISGFQDEGQGSRDTEACIIALPRLARRTERSLGARDAARNRRSTERIRDAARDDDRVDIAFEDGHADVLVDASRDEEDDGYFRVEREDGRWRMGMYPETATLR